MSWWIIATAVVPLVAFGGARIVRRWIQYRQLEREEREESAAYQAGFHDGFGQGYKTARRKGENGRSPRHWKLGGDRGQQQGTL